jgi:hypothetical protein
LAVEKAIEVSHGYLSPWSEIAIEAIHEPSEDDVYERYGLECDLVDGN